MLLTPDTGDMWSQGELGLHKISTVAFSDNP